MSKGKDLQGSLDWRNKNNVILWSLILSSELEITMGLRFFSVCVCINVRTCHDLCVRTRRQLVGL